VGTWEVFEEEHMHAPTTATRIDFAAIKDKQRAAWAAGNYGKMGTRVQLAGEELAEVMAVRPGSLVLDVAAGTGNVTLALARRGARVVSTDYVESLLEQGRRRAEAEGLEVTFDVADAEALPYDDGCFDAVASTFGVMFAPDQARAAQELVRVTRPGGRIGLVSWTPDSFVGNLFRTVGHHVPPPAGLVSPTNWGRREWIAQHFDGKATHTAFRLKHFVFVDTSPRAFVDLFRTWYGPVHRAFASLDEAGQQRLEQDMRALIAEFDTGSDGTMRVASEYAEVVIDLA
jgi:ubiquinone/menaquinone biosynthesis C-methylase UbiE